LFVAIAMLREVAVSAGEVTTRACVTEGSTKPRKVIAGVEGSLLRSDRKLRALSSKVGVMSCVLGRSGGVDAEACGDAIGQCLAMGPASSDVVHGIVRARQLDVETGIGEGEV